MENQSAEKHADLEVIARYVDNELDESRADELELHVAECKECRESVRMARRMASALSLAAHTVTPDSHAATVEAWELAKSFDEDRVRVPAGMTAVAKLELFGIARSGIDDLGEARTSRSFERALVGSTARGPEGTQAGMKGLVDKWRVVAEGEPKISVAIDPSKKQVIAEFRGKDLETPGPVVALVPEDPARQTLFKNARRKAKGDCMRAVFSKVPEGNYKVLIGPAK